MHFGEPVYHPSDEERRQLLEALEAHRDDPAAVHDWEAVREQLHSSP